MTEKQKGARLSKKTMEDLSDLMIDKHHRDGLQTFPREFEQYQKLADLYDKAHTGYGGGNYLEFFNQGRGWIKPSKAKQLFKKFGFLLSLDDKKAANWIFENISEQDFFALLEAAMHTGDPSDLQELNMLLQPIYWFPELVWGNISQIENFPEYNSELADITFGAPRPG